MSVANENMRICLICGRTLEDWLTPSTGKRVYRHGPVDRDADHLPVAVRPEEAPEQVRFRCDFCLEEPVTHTLVADRETGMLDGLIRWDTEWTMCAPCTELVQADDWLNLRRRIFTLSEQQYGAFSEETKVEMRVALRDLRDAMVMIYQESA